MANDKRERMKQITNELRQLTANMPTLEEALDTAVRELLDEGTTTDKLYELVDLAVDAAIATHESEDENAHSDSPHADYAGYHAMLKATGRKCSVCEAENKLMNGVDSSKPN